MNGFLLLVMLCPLTTPPQGCRTEAVAEQSWRVGPLECKRAVEDCYWECMDTGWSYAAGLMLTPEKLALPSGRFGVRCIWSKEA